MRLTHCLRNPGVPILLLVLATLSGCSAPNPLKEVAQADRRCPDLSGSYCARGRQYQGGSDYTSATHLASFLPLADADQATRRLIRSADRIDISGGHDGRLGISVYVEGQTIYRTDLDAAGYRCGVDTLLLEDPGQILVDVGSPLLPLVATGWDDAHNLLWKCEDGGLRAHKQRRSSGTVMLAIPFRFDDDFRARFRPFDQGCE